MSGRSLIIQNKTAEIAFLIRWNYEHRKELVVLYFAYFIAPDHIPNMNLQQDGLPRLISPVIIPLHDDGDERDDDDDGDGNVEN